MMERYSSYKDSSVEWIGEIPSHWKKVSTKNICKIFNGSTPKSNDEYWNGDIIWITPSDIGPVKHEMFISSSKRMITQEGLDSCGCNLCPENSLILTNRGPIGNVIISTIPFTTNQGCKVMVPNEVINVKLLYYFFSISSEELNNLGQGTTFLELSTSSLSSFKVPLPPLSEQSQIVQFLDEKTSLIDSLIEKTKRKIELLKEERTSLINHTVTKGLNPNVEMKDSGVEWIGEIPRGWKLYSGSYLGEYSKGKGIKKDEVLEFGLPCLRYGEIYTHYDLKFVQTRSFINDETSEISVSCGYGTLFLTGSGEKSEEIGKCVVYLGENQIWVGGDIIVLKPYERFNPLFLSYLINSECIRIQREISSKGDIIVHIYSKNFREMKFPIPPLSEQEEIVQFLDEKTSTIDKTIELEGKRIELLKEYRQSLISEVVTGKIKVITDE